MVANNDLIPQVVIRCREAAGAEAIAWGYPSQLGFDVFDGTVVDDLESWDETQFAKWCREIDSKYPMIPTDKIMEFYVRVSELMGEYYNSMVKPTLNQLS